MSHFCGFAGPPRCATRVALTHVPLRAPQMQMRELYDQSEYVLWFSPCFFRSSRRRKLFLDRFLQGKSVAESGSIISHYFRTYFSLYVVPRGLIRNHLWLTIYHDNCTHNLPAQKGFWGLKLMANSWDTWLVGGILAPNPRAGNILSLGKNKQWRNKSTKRNFPSKITFNLAYLPWLTSAISDSYLLFLPRT